MEIKPSQDFPVALRKLNQYLFNQFRAPPEHGIFLRVLARVHHAHGRLQFRKPSRSRQWTPRIATSRTRALRRGWKSRDATPPRKRRLPRKDDTPPSTLFFGDIGQRIRETWVFASSIW